ncbi:MAG: HD domain-containing protein [Oscillospiraceae bacterium]|jgi:HD-GYP domain-containing protein (c-di-GMP phosphodiesterase class II)|nr:HD domain-containing protein [Oscillospiraceae bacterium]
MRADLLLKTISKGIDLVEKDVTGATLNHGKRVAVLCGLMGREMGLSDDDLTAFTTCALLHDSALTEWLSLRGNDEKGHCVIGQKNIKLLPFKSSVDGFILYHHEYADGRGLFGKKTGEYPFKAELIGLADRLDVEYNFSQGISEIDYNQSYSLQAREIFGKILYKYHMELKDENIDTAWLKYIPPWTISDNESVGIAKFMIKIIDAKSAFTARHSSGIAKKALVMSDFYHYDENTAARLYLAAALHDLGKLGVSSAVLEKPGSLTDNEFEQIKNHVRLTYYMLNDLEGFDDVKNWAANHHEKLDGTGYPFGKKADELDFNSRLMACIDIYQAVSEPRPYHDERSHEETMPILYSMSQKGFIDEKIVNDINIAFAAIEN